MPPSPCTGSTMTAQVCPVTAARSLVEIVEGHQVEALRHWAEALVELLLAGRGDGSERAAVEAALDRDDAEALRLALVGIMFADELDAAFDRLEAGIAEEDRVREAVLDQTTPGSFLVGDIVQVRGMPKPAGLVLERGDKAGMGVAESGHGDPAAEVQEPPPVGREEPGSLAFLESDVPVPIGRHQGGDHESISFRGSANGFPAAGRRGSAQ